MLLSYLQGLAPVGEPFEFNRVLAVEDLELSARSEVSIALRRLKDVGAVECIDWRLVVVRKRVEEFEIQGYLTKSERARISCEIIPPRKPARKFKLIDPWREDA